MTKRQVVEYASVVHEPSGLCELLPKLRKKYRHVRLHPSEIHLREVKGVWQVVAYVDKPVAGQLRRGADGVVVLAEANSWQELLG